MKLAEGMTAQRTNYGTTYVYKNVRITKSYNGYHFREEVIIMETGRAVVKDSYTQYQLKDAPATINRMLDTGSYYVDSLGIVRLTESRKREIREARIEIYEAEVKELHNKVEMFLREGAYGNAQKYLNGLIEKQQRLDTCKANLEEGNK